MLKQAILTLGLAGTMTYSVADAFDNAKSSVGQVAQVYQAAAQINHYGSYEEIQRQQARLKQAAGQLPRIASLADNELKAYQNRNQIRD